MNLYSFDLFYSCMDCTRFSHDPVIYKSTQLKYVNAADNQSCM